MIQAENELKSIHGRPWVVGCHYIICYGKYCTCALDLVESIETEGFYTYELWLCDITHQEGCQGFR